MREGIDPRHAREALRAIDPGLSRDEWHRVGRAAIAAGLTVDDIDEWSAGAPNYSGSRDVRAAFRAIKPEGGTGPGTLYRMAMDAGWKPPQSDGDQRQHHRATRPEKSRHRPAQGRRGPSAAEVWDRCEPATAAHPYIEAKAGMPDGLRVVPEGDPLTVAGERVAGCLVVPVLGDDGSPLSLQFIAPPDMATRWKAAGKPGKLNLTGSSMGEGGRFVVGQLEPGGVAYLVEGIGQAWACWKATGAAAVVCFGWGRVQKVAQALRRRDADVRLVLVPDAGKEQAADAIAAELGAAVARMPEGSPANFDACDYAQANGFDTLELLLEQALRPPLRYRLLGRADLQALPLLPWRVRGVLPAQGVAAVYGPSGSGKSFLVVDLAAAIAEAAHWFGHRSKAAPVVYVCLEGEAGLRQRVEAWEHANGRPLPEALRLVLQGFKLGELRDVQDLAAAVRETGAEPVVILDTLNRAAPEADENASADMGRIVEAAKLLQQLTGGLVVLVHHTGKDTGKGMRGHSSLFAALDAAVEVSRTDGRREWKVAKSKDGRDGIAQPFRLEVVELGTDDDGEPLTSCVVRPEVALEPITRSNLPKGGNQRVVLDALTELLRDSRKFGQAGAPGCRPCVETEVAVEAIAPRLACEPVRRKERTRQALTGLIAAGIVVSNGGWLWLA